MWKKLSSWISFTFLWKKLYSWISFTKFLIFYKLVMFENVWQIEGIRIPSICHLLSFIMLTFAYNACQLAYKSNWVSITYKFLLCWDLQTSNFNNVCRTTPHVLFGWQYKCCLEKGNAWQKPSILYFMLRKRNERDGSNSSGIVEVSAEEIAVEAVVKVCAVGAAACGRPVVSRGSTYSSCAPNTLVLQTEST